MASNPISAALAVGSHTGQRTAFSWALIWAAAALAALAAMYVSTADNSIRLYLGAIGGMVLLTAALIYVSHHRQWLIFALVMVEAILSTNYVPIPVALRPAARYPLLFLLCLPVVPLTIRSGIFKRGEFKHFAIYLGFAVLSTLWSLIPSFSIGRSLGAFAAYCAICAVTLEVNNKRDLDRILWHFMLATGLAVALLPLSLLVFPTEMAWLPDLGILRFRGMYESPNQVGELMLSGASAGLLCWSSASGYKKLFAATTVALAVFFTILANSRTSIVAILVGLFAYVLWRYRFKGFAVCCLVAVLAVGGLTAMGKDYSDYINRGGQFTTLTGRTDVWKFALQKIAERPLLGYGYEVEGEIFRGHDFTVWWGPWDMGPRSSLHNGYISRAISLGVPGLAAWLFIMLRPWIWLFRRSGDPLKLKPVFWLGIVPILVLMIDETAVGDCRYTIGIFMFLMWAIVERQRLTWLDHQSRKERADSETRHERTPLLAAVMGG